MSEETVINLSRRIKEILALAKAGETGLLDLALDNLLANPYAPSEHQEEIEVLYGKDKESKGNYFDSLSHPACIELLRGAFGFFLFASATEEFGIAEETNEPAKARAELYLKTSETTAFIFTKYKVQPKYRHVSLTLHRAGTTSYILKFNMSGENYVLKIVKYYYRDNRLIAESTKKYKLPFENTDLYVGYAPKVFESEDGFVIMEYIQGKSLREFMCDDFLVDRKEKITQIRKIVSTLCSILGHYAGNELPHLDLSPENILVKDHPRTKDDIEIVLIDFGYNYLLNKKVSSESTAFLRAQTYIAPELKQPDIHRKIKLFSLQKKILADVYSLGIILLEMLSERSPTNDGKVEEFSKNEVIERHRREYPGLGDVLEGVTDSNSDIRLFSVSPDRNTDEQRSVGKHFKDIYEYIGNRIDVELQIYEDVYLAEGNKRTWWAILFRVLQIIKDPIDVLLKHGEKYDYLKKNAFGGVDHAKQVRDWSFVCQYMNISMVALTIILAWYSYKQGSLITNLPRLVVGFSFSLLATQYYMNIFSTLFSSGVQSRLIRLKDDEMGAFTSLSRSGFQSRLPGLAEKSFRISSFYFGILIAACYFLDRKWWPFLTFVACMVTVSNNYLSYRLALEARQFMKDELGGDKISQSMNDFLNPGEFRNWTIVFFVYACAPLFIGIGLTLGLISDVLVYALIIVLCNWIMLKRRCSGRDAERVRIELERAISGYLKALKYREYKDREANRKSALK